MKCGWTQRPGAAAFLVALLVLVPAAGAHTPHHDISQLEVSPAFSEDRTLYVIVRGNLHRSVDGGREWKRLVRGLDHEHILSSLAVARADPDVLYLATLGDGLFRSVDAGSSWARLRGTPAGGAIAALAVSPASADALLAIGEAGGLFSTEDAGTSWKAVIPEASRPKALAFAADGRRAAVGDESGALFASRDGGRSWAKLRSVAAGAVSALAFEPGPEARLWAGSSVGQLLRVDIDTGDAVPIPLELDGEPITGIAFSPDFPTDGSVWVAARRFGVARSRDRGGSWRRCDAGLTTDPQAREFARPDFNEIEALQGQAGGPRVFLAGFDGLFVSRDGCRWSGVPVLSTVTVTGLGVSPDYARDRSVAVGTYLWGAYLSRDGGRTWKPSRAGMAEGRRNGIARTFDVVFSPAYSRDGTLFSNTWWLLLKSTDRGARWQQRNPGGGGYSIGVSPGFERDGAVYLTTMLGRILRSTDRGEHFVEVGGVPQPIGTIVLSPDFEHDRTLFLGAAGAIHRSVDAGEAWERADAGINFPPLDPQAGLPRWKRELSEQRAGVHLAVSPAFAEDQSLFAGTARGLFRSNDRGLRWERVFPRSAAETGIVEAVAVSPGFAEDRTVLLSVRGRGLFRSGDGGSTFREVARELIESNVQLAHPFGFPLAESPAIEFSPDFPRDRTVFGFSGSSVFRSRDRGDSWEGVRLPEPSYDALTLLRLEALVLARSRAVRAASALLVCAATLSILWRVRGATSAAARVAWSLLLLALGAAVLGLWARLAP